MDYKVLFCVCIFLFFYWQSCFIHNKSLETRDSGKLFTDSVDDMDLTVKCFRYYAGWADKITGKTISSGEYLVLRRSVNGTVFLGSFSFKLTSKQSCFKIWFYQTVGPSLFECHYMYLASWRQKKLIKSQLCFPIEEVKARSDNPIGMHRLWQQCVFVV